MAGQILHLLPLPGQSEAPLRRMGEATTWTQGFLWISMGFLFFSRSEILGSHLATCLGNTNKTVALLQTVHAPLPLEGLLIFSQGRWGCVATWCLNCSSGYHSSIQVLRVSYLWDRGCSLSEHLGVRKWHLRLLLKPFFSFKILWKFTILWITVLG